MPKDFLDDQKRYFDKYFADLEIAETKATRYEFSTMVSFMGEDMQGKRILDLGCGTGRNGIKLAALTSAEVIGIDISYVAVEKANALAKKMGVSNFHALKDDFKVIRCPDLLTIFCV